MKKRDNAKNKIRKSQPYDDDGADTQYNQDVDDFGAKTVMKPEDQLQLTDAELKEEISRVLTAYNPHAPQNIVRFSFKEGQYKQMPHVDQMAIHFYLEGSMIHKDSDEAKRQLSQKGIATDDENVEDEEQGGRQRESGKKLVNQFNFCERSTQTYNNPLRERSNMTEPPPRANFSANVTQWIIYDEYVEDFERQQEKRKEKKAPAFGQKQEHKIKKKMAAGEIQTDDLTKFKRPMRIVERMVNQNTFDEIAQDFKYYEDQSDEYREQLGTLLPLWKFCYEKTKNMAVTALCWSPRYKDLFAVGHGSYDFQKQTSGLVAFYTLKNPGFPEYIFETESGVLSLDLHPKYPHLMCVGFYDGAVGVYNLNQKKVTPLYLSTAKTGKHTDPVWQVRWQNNDLDSNLNFFSVSADGRVTSWVIVKEGVGNFHECPNDISHFDAMLLRMVDNSEDPVETPQLITPDCGTAFDFHKTLDHLFLVATEEGMVHKCSKAFSSQYLKSYEAHHMAVYRVMWNSFHPDIFITCSADWTVKIWDHNKCEPIFVFDLGSPVGDVAWAPYSSTVFAAVTADGRVHVYELAVNKYEPLCNQLVVQKKKTKLTHISFNPKDYVIIVGDERGQITSLKLSPNLHKQPKEKKGVEMPKGPEYEIAKLDKILSLVG